MKPSTLVFNSFIDLEFWAWSSGYKLSGKSTDRFMQVKKGKQHLGNVYPLANDRFKFFPAIEEDLGTPAPPDFRL